MNTPTHSHDMPSPVMPSCPPQKLLRGQKALKNMQILQRGNRLSITPVDPREWEFILGLLK